MIMFLKSDDDLGETVTRVFIFLTNGGDIPWLRVA